MATVPPRSRRAATDSATQIVETGRSILSQEAAALHQLAARLDDTFVHAVKLIVDCPGCVITTGMGKAGLIGQKIAATLASTGTPSHFLHPAEAVHGDLGRICPGDLLMVLSFSGETDEVTRLLDCLPHAACPVLAITGRAGSTLGQRAACTLTLGAMREAGPLRLAPSTTTTAMLGLGDALALAVAEQRDFGEHDFARFHPGGALGRKLARVEEAMRPRDRCRIADQRRTVREILVQVGQPGRRSGAILLVDEAGRLSGIFTDSDLARLFEDHREGAIDGPIAEVMSPQPTCVVAGTMLTDAMALLATRKISELPVVNADGVPIGLIDITDVVQPPGDRVECAALPVPDRLSASAEGNGGWRETLPFPRRDDDLP